MLIALYNGIHILSTIEYTFMYTTKYITHADIHSFSHFSGHTICLHAHSYTHSRKQHMEVAKQIHLSGKLHVWLKS